MSKVKKFDVLTYDQIREKLLSGETTCESIVKKYLEKIKKYQNLNAFLSVFEEKAIKKAVEIDEKIKSGTAGKLAGMVIAIKDNICVKDERCTCASKILENFISLYNATAVERLLKEDAIIIGKTNLDEFAMGSSTENSYFGPTLNPYDEERVPGGSSGGSAVAVAAGLSTTALGSDTGGSIRQPAAFCGVYGLKPTYGRVSRFGLVAFASSFDVIGPFGNSTKDVALVLQVIAGHDENDSTSANMPVPDYLSYLDKDVKGLRVGIPVEYFSEGLEDEIKEAIEKQIDFLRENGAIIEKISLPHTEYNIPTYYILVTAEASSNLARYDGARYGYRSPNAKSLYEMYVKSRSEGFGPEVKRRIMLGTYVLSAGYYEAYYRKAQKVRRLIKEDFDRAFENVDVIITPTSPTTAFKIGEKTDDPLKMYLSDIYTVSVNLAGVPAINVPVGFDSKGLPIGMQIIGRQFDEGTILRVSDFLERNYKV
ncbi:Asp-tRNA(Asn)/Glu-tRNA(Gln) amidotransferase subunit GatA [Candidatus Kryptobacter tengchongensis]|uniref:Glutamyl-tRNA(Gln) amidotransferase subunit A n=1 Tax=Kryptobacter tengchongensis TaxID=1643429 RepID=A0A656D5J3_KRYT1|nr:Asp-tRNA(Asn)/Glu-tRNA(Gln) amidotransferase subunit GatA [Candidatus Kryptobacter tengchongensis]CUS85800.1 aspartyl/glutamyl-tRNA(Asn/Gln) amidotransferase subunit A [Candidatus Kryptobacter tengchongensis]CUT00269.1 aspartyl/glutamyl-tRNA(Asn/Gln) amidotransferase subunit A [Candidatus Kryptobacter tengchongensis]